MLYHKMVTATLQCTLSVLFPFPLASRKKNDHPLHLQVCKDAHDTVAKSHCRKLLLECTCSDSLQHEVRIRAFSLFYFNAQRFSIAHQLRELPRKSNSSISISLTSIRMVPAARSSTTNVQPARKPRMLYAASCLEGHGALVTDNFDIKLPGIALTQDLGVLKAVASHAPNQ